MCEREEHCLAVSEMKFGVRVDSVTCRVPISTSLLRRSHCLFRSRYIVNGQYIIVKFRVVPEMHLQRVMGLGRIGSHMLMFSQ